jgi:hypothetical protein
VPADQIVTFNVRPSTAADGQNIMEDFETLMFDPVSKSLYLVSKDRETP